MQTSKLKADFAFLLCKIQQSQAKLLLILLTWVKNQKSSDSLYSFTSAGSCNGTVREFYNMHGRKLRYCSSICTWNILWVQNSTIHCNSIG